MRKTILFTLGFLGLLAVPAMAQLGRVWTDFQSYSTDLQNYLRYNVSETLNPLETSSQNALSSSGGDLNIPNPIEAGNQVRRDVLFFNSIPDKFENNQAIRANAVTNEINRYIIRSTVQGMLGREGQERMKAKLENTETSIKTIEESANDAEQNILKLPEIPILNDVAGNTLRANINQSNLQAQSVRIQAEQSKMVSENLYQTILLNQSLQYSNLNLASISQQMEEANRSRRVDTSTEGARLLRNTAQIDLFGRNINGESTTNEQDERQ
jgi:hypothetical protein